MDLALGSLLALVYRVMGMFFWMILGIITARALSVEDRGVYVSTVAVVQGAGAIAASFASSSGYFVANRGRPAAEVATNGAILSVAVSVGLLALSLLAWLLYKGDGRHLLPLMGIAAFPIIARHALGGVFVGVSALWRYNFSVHGPAYTAVAILLVWVVLLDHRTVEDALGGWIIGQFAALALLTVMGWRWWSWLANHKPNWPLIRNLVTFGAVTGLAGFVSYFNYRVDLLLVAAIDGTTGAGVYSAAVAVAEGLWLFSTAISIASYAAVGSMSREDAAELTARSCRHTLLVVGVGAIAAIILAPLVIEILFGDRYSGATTSLRILCIGTALFAPLALLSNYFTVQLGRPSISLVLAFGSFVINVIVSVVLIPKVGYVGGAWATSISYAATAVAATLIFLGLSGARFRDLWQIRADDIASYFRLGRRVLRGALFGRA